MKSVSVAVFLSLKLFLEGVGAVVGPGATLKIPAEVQYYEYRDR
jgi:hypothetical protein